MAMYLRFPKIVKSMFGTLSAATKKLLAADLGIELPTGKGKGKGKGRRPGTAPAMGRARSKSRGAKARKKSTKRNKGSLKKK